MLHMCPFFGLASLLQLENQFTALQIMACMRIPLSAFA